jgi:hypothetical protein
MITADFATALSAINDAIAQHQPGGLLSIEHHSDNSSRLPITCRASRDCCVVLISIGPSGIAWCIGMAGRNYLVPGTKASFEDCSGRRPHCVARHPCYMHMEVDIMWRCGRMNLGPEKVRTCISRDRPCAGSPSLQDLVRRDVLPAILRNSSALATHGSVLMSRRNGTSVYGPGITCPEEVHM